MWPEKIKRRKFEAWGRVRKSCTYFFQRKDFLWVVERGKGLCPVSICVPGYLDYLFSEAKGKPVVYSGPICQISDLLLDYSGRFMVWNKERTDGEIRLIPRHWSFAAVCNFVQRDSYQCAMR